MDPYGIFRISEVDAHAPLVWWLRVNLNFEVDIPRLLNLSSIVIYFFSTTLRFLKDTGFMVESMERWWQTTLVSIPYM